MERRIVSADTWPAVPTEQDGAQRWPRGRARRRGGNPANRLRAVMPLNHWIAREGAIAGGAETNRWTWSGWISSARISTPFAWATSLSRAAQAVGHGSRQHALPILRDPHRVVGALTYGIARCLDAEIAHTRSLLPHTGRSSHGVNAGVSAPTGVR